MLCIFITVAICCSIASLPAAVIISLLMLLATLLVKFELAIYPLLLFSAVESMSFGFALNASPYEVIPYYDALALLLPVVLFGFLGYLATILCKARVVRAHNPIAIHMVTLLVFSASTLAYAPSIAHSSIQFLNLAANMGMYLLILLGLRDEQAHRRAVWFWVLWGGLQAILLFAFYFLSRNQLAFTYDLSPYIVIVSDIATGFHPPLTNTLRRGSAFFGHNGTALAMNLTIPFAVGLLCYEKKLAIRALLLAIIALLFAATLMTMSRAGAGSMLIMCCTLFLLENKLRRYFFILCPICVVAVFAVTELERTVADKLFFRENSESRLLKMMSESNKSGVVTAKERLAKWEGGMKRLAKTFPLGDGVGNFKYYTRMKTFPHAHSVYFSFLFDFGIPGVIILIAIVFSIVRYYYKYVNRGPPYVRTIIITSIGGFVAIAIHGLVDFEYNTKLIWAFLALSISALNLAGRSEA